MALNEDSFQIGFTVYRFMASCSAYCVLSQEGSNIYLLQIHMQLMVTP